MARYCILCGKELKTSYGPVGPVCLKKTANKTLRQSCKVPNEIQIKYLKKHDLFGDSDEQGKVDATGTDTQKKEDGQSDESQSAT